MATLTDGTVPLGTSEMRTVELIGTLSDDIFTVTVDDVLPDATATAVFSTRSGIGRNGSR